MKILVCGGRRYDNRGRMWEVLGAYEDRITLLIHGAAPGADLLAEKWAKERQIDYRGCPAKWTKEGDAAGPIRNKRMLATTDPELVIAFPGGHGTSDCVTKAMDKGIQVVRVDWFGPGFDGTALPKNMPRYESTLTKG